MRNKIFMIISFLAAVLIVSSCLKDDIGEDWTSSHKGKMYAEIWNAGFQAYALEPVAEPDTFKFLVNIATDELPTTNITLKLAVNEGAMTISIPAGSVAGDLYGYGATAIYYGDDVTFDEFASIDGTIEADGTINIDKLTMILTDYGFVDGYWDAFNTTWTKSAKKAATTGRVPASKADRFK